MDKEIKRVKKRPIALIVAIGIIGLALFTGMVMLQRRTEFVDYNYTLLMTTKAMNLRCPYDAGDGVRVDSITAKFDKQMWFHISLLSMVRNDTTIDAFCGNYKEKMIEAYKAQEVFEDFGKNNVTVYIDLRDGNGSQMCLTVISPQDYYNPTRDQR
jgi:hypothetical protein